MAPHDGGPGDQVDDGGGCAVLGVAVVAAVASYENAYDLAQAHGEVG